MGAVMVYGPEGQYRDLVPADRLVSPVYCGRLPGGEIRDREECGVSGPCLERLAATRADVFTVLIDAAAAVGGETRGALVATEVRGEVVIFVQVGSAERALVKVPTTTAACRAAVAAQSSKPSPNAHTEEDKPAVVACPHVGYSGCSGWRR